jgi:hypothetical protein
VEYAAIIEEVELLGREEHITGGDDEKPSA